MPTRRTILVVDDEPDVVETLASMLAGAGYDVETASHGAEALDVLARRAVDAILCDSRMPVLSGPDFYRALERRYPALCRRIAFVSGDILSVDRREFLEETGVPTLAKPFSIEDVCRLVRRLLEG